MSEPLILIVDDDTVHLNLLQRTLLGRAQVKLFSSSEEFLESQVLSAAHLVILDWDLPGMNGLDTLKTIRLKYNIPVLFLTSFNTESKIVAALTSGADDYLVKPFRAAELLARIQVLLRRFQSYQAAKIIKTSTTSSAALAATAIHPADDSYPLMEGIKVNSLALTLTIPNQPEVKLSNKEFALAILFFKNIGRALPRDEITQAVWGKEEDISSRTLDTHVSRLRTRLNLRPQAGWRLLPVYSVGYRLDVCIDPLFDDDTIHLHNENNEKTD